MKSLTENRQSIKISSILIICSILFLLLSVYAQDKGKKINYAIKSNVLDPDTLRKGTNEYKIFWHFVEWSHKEVDEIETLTLKAEFEKLGISTKDEEFHSAYSFFSNEVVYHKRSVENWENFKDLAPEKNPD